MGLRLGEVLQHAHDAKLWSTPVTTDFRKQVNALFAVLEQTKTRYLLVGGVAMLSYVEGRNTEDINLIVNPSDLSARASHPTPIGELAQ